MPSLRLLWTGVLAMGLVPAVLRAASVELDLTQKDGTPLADAVLAAYPLDARPLPPPAPAVMDQRNRKYTPHILPVETHARVTFANSDTVSHHVYSFSPPRRFQLFLTKGEAAKTVTFDQPGVVTLGCNLHDWMLGYILVLDTPYFTQTDAAGRATRAGLPAGRYRLEVWHPRITDRPEALRRAVEIEAVTRQEWTLRLAQPLLPARDQKPGVADY